MSLKSSSSFRQSALLTSGTILNSLLGLVFYILVARVLGPSPFGYFSFILGIGVLAADLGDLGLGPAIVKFGHSERFRSIFTIVFLQTILISLLFLVIAAFVAVFFGENFIYSALIAISLLCVYLLTQSFLAQQKYVHYVFTNIFGNTVRLVLVAFLISSKILDTNSALQAFFLANFASFTIAFLLLALMNKHLPLDLSGLRKNFKEVINFSGWLAASFGISAISSRIDIPLVYTLAGGGAAGIYSTASKLNSVFPQVAASIDGVFSPKFSKKEAVEKNTRDYLVLALLFSAGLAVLMLFSPLVVKLLFTEKYLGSILVFNIMLLGMVCFTLSGPFAARVIYFHGKSSFHLVSSIIQLALSLSLYLLLIPAFGPIGAAVTFVVTNLASLIFFFSADRYLSNK